MKRVVALLSLMFLPVLVVQADIAPPPLTLHAVSDDGHVVRVERSRPVQGERQTTTAILFAFDPAQGSYVRTSQFDLKFASEYLYLARGGKYVVAVNKGHWLAGDAIGIRIFTPDGTLVRQWRLHDFLKSEEIAGIRKSSSTTWWYSGGEMRDHWLTFWGPEALRPGDDRKRIPFRFTLDTEALELKRQPSENEVRAREQE